MKRIPITGADCDPSGAFHLHKDHIAAVGGVVEGEKIIVYLCDEPEVEFEAVVVRHPSWPSYFFARETGALSTSDEA
jgi:hypothetical protein